MQRLGTWKMCTIENNVHYVLHCFNSVRNQRSDKRIQLCLKVNQSYSVYYRNFRKRCDWIMLLESNVRNNRFFSCYATIWIFFIRKIIHKAQHEIAKIQSSCNIQIETVTEVEKRSIVSNSSNDAKVNE